LNKHFGTRVSISGATQALCRDIRFRPTASVVLKGKSNPIQVWEPLQEDDGRGDFMARYCEAYAMLKVDAAGAGLLFETLVQELPDDPCAKFHHHRIHQGIFGDTIVMTEK